MGDLLEVDAALGRGDEGDARGGAVDQAGEVQLAGDLAAFLDIEAMDGPALRSGLRRDQRYAQHALALAPDILERAHHLDAAALAAAAGMDLGLDDIDRSAELLGGG